MTRRFWLETLGCPKNQVDSDKLAGTLAADGMAPAPTPDQADLVVVNTCAFIGEAREESVATILELDGQRREGSRLVVTGCMAERYGDELAEALPEVDRVAGFGVPVTLGRRPASHAGESHQDVPTLDLLNLPRPPAERPWAYLKIAEGCDRACGFCAIPSFRGPQRSRDLDSLVAEVDQLGAREIVLVAQDLAAYGRDVGRGGSIVELVENLAGRVDRVRLLYLYPSDLDDRLIEAIAATGVPYYDLSLQHVSPPHLRRMRRWGNGARFRDSIDRIRRLAPEAVFRSNFIVGYPGETEDDHAALVEFVTEVGLDWCGFFLYSEEEGTYAADLEPKVPAEVASERLRELTEIQDRVTAERRMALVGREVEVLVDRPGEGRTHREAPEIDGMVRVPEELAVGEFHRVVVIDAEGPDLFARSTVVAAGVAP